MKERLLVVDDDAALRELLQRYLGEHGYEVACVGDGVEMERYLAAHDVELIILDLMLPGEDGLSLASRLRSRISSPIIMLSARGEEVDRIVGLEVGADDYLAKPFNPRELLARIRAVLRRAQGVAVAQEPFRFGPYHFDGEGHRLSCDGEEVALTTAEFTLLRVFVEHPNRVLSRDQLLDMIKGYERNPFDRSIDVRVRRLRNKIEPDPSRPVYIRTVWGEGYLFRPSGVE